MTRLVALALCALTGCTAIEPGLPLAQELLSHGDLLGSLTELDAIPPSEPDYALSRTVAKAIERRIRTSQQLFARGLSLRSEWRDDEAIEAFELARQVWPRAPAVAGMAEATRRRRSALDAPVGHAPRGGAVAMTRPVTPEVAAPELAPDEFTDHQWIPAAPGGAAAPPAIGLPEVPIELRLARAVADLDAGDLASSLAELEELHDLVPAHRAIRRELVRGLHRRALLHYGQGQLEPAIIQWTRVAELDPGLREAREFREAAQIELDLQRAR